MSGHTPSKVKIEFLKALKSVDPITKEIFRALKQLTTEEIKDCVDIPPKNSPYSYALNCKKLYYKYIKPKIENST